jgi:flagellar biosynthesis/type III secretory pathway chaperone
MLRNIPSSTLKELLRLSERKEVLIAQIQAIDREMLKVQERFGIPAREDQRGSVTVSQSRLGPIRPRSKRGALKEKIIRALRGAGKKGATVAELSKKLKVPSANLYVWFNGTGRSVTGIKKIGVAKYQLR